MEILYAALVLGGMGLLFGGLLTLTSKIFAVPANPKRDAVRELLPSANCGACGYPGCDGCADAIVSGKASVNACPVGGAETAAKIGEVMGVKPADPSTRLVARVICKGHNEHCKDKFDYKGISDCVAASLVSDGPRSCKYACIGMGSCVRACAFDAIHMDENRHIALIDENKCVGCGKCVATCPKGVLDLHPVTEPVRVMCRAAEEGILVSDKEQSSYIKPYVDAIDQQIMFAEKSWGSFRVLDVEKESMTIKVTLNAGHRMNYHSHQHRDEVWVVTAGTGRTVVDGMEQPVRPGDVVTMQAGCRHTVMADSELQLVEVQLGKDISVQDKQKYELED